jgi:hypothetical protein
MRFIAGCCLLMLVASVSHAQPTPASGQSAKEQRQASGMKDKVRPDRSQAEAAAIKKQQKEAKERQDRQAARANAEMQMGVASGAAQIGAGAGKKSAAPDVTKGAVKKPVQPPLSNK